MLLRGMQFSVPTGRQVQYPCGKGGSVAMQEGRFTSCAGTEAQWLFGDGGLVAYGNREVISLAGKAFAKACSRQGVKDPAAEQRLESRTGTCP